jgi:hypothetical protein
MLVDIDLMAPETDHLRERWREIRNQLGHPDEEFVIADRTSRGIYRGTNLVHELEYALASESRYETFPIPRLDFDLEIEEECVKHRREIQKWANGPKTYGMCDSPEQVVLKWPWLEWTDRCFIIEWHTYDATGEAEGGFRPHKHGKYIGDGELLGYEYLKDEPYVNKVVLFHILEIKPEYVVEIEDD